MRISKRDRLLKDSDLIITQIRAIDNSRFLEKVAVLSQKEYEKAKSLFGELID